MDQRREHGLNWSWACRSELIIIQEKTHYRLCKIFVAEIYSNSEIYLTSPLVYSQCENFKIFLLPRFYVKTILENVPKHYAPGTFKM